MFLQACHRVPSTYARGVQTFHHVLRGTHAAKVVQKFGYKMMWAIVAVGEVRYTARCRDYVCSRRSKHRERRGVALTEVFRSGVRWNFHYRPFTAVD